MTTTSTSRPLLLLVEDNPADVFLVREAISAAGLSCDFHVVDDGEKAVAFIDRVEETGDPAPMLLLLDLNVPRRSGDEVLQRVRMSPRCALMPIIIMTSSDSPQDRKRASDLGANEYFRKPAKLDEFMKLGGVVARLLEEADLATTA